MSRPLLRRQAIAASIASVALPTIAQAQPRPVTRIAFGSCADQAKPQPVWDAVLGYRPDLFLFLGDNVYADYVAGPATIESMRTAYSATDGIEGYARLRHDVQHMAVWDDHDYGQNDGGVGFALKDEAKSIFLDFWKAAADDPRRSREGVHDARLFGQAGQRVQVILLDVRWSKSPWRPTDERNAAGKERYLPDEDPAKTILGEAQWAWLAEQLRVPADLRIIGSGIQMVADGHGWERWGNFPRERQKLYDTIRDTGANGVVLISGDRHLGALYRETNGTPYPLLEATSSGLNKFFPNPREAGPNRLGGVYGAPNFGTIDVDWWEGKVALAIRDEAGQAVRRAEVHLDGLKPA
ncbi:alkaline phosphatase D family protein [Reyranella sp. CPCC 100927]|uniref:alkaline phosphatase D family protein n=1 Tax=Reyranella sp. CPCC 100927 TaxID=2599616 RepID=UPI0011B3E140|nr:alkaline phosphatase D family protein [Reyranella sp. CPCC 100927]TWT09513.1 alkaline phosphatase family protein [Reyranella sp. CPCC 100927]